MFDELNRRGPSAQNRGAERCGRCGLGLPAGAVHVSQDGCIDALREALSRASACDECGEPVPQPRHAACMAKAAARVGSSAAIDAGVRKATDAAVKFFYDRTKPDNREEGNR